MNEENQFFDNLPNVEEIYDMEGCPCRQICYITKNRCTTEACTKPHDFLNFVFLECDTPLNTSIVNVSRCNI